MINLFDPRPVGQHTVVEVAGEIDVAGSTALRDSLLALLNRGADSLVVDLRGVTFIDSTGVGSLLRVYHRQSLLGGCVHFVADQPAVLRLLEVMQLTRRLHVVASIGSVDRCCPAAPPVVVQGRRPGALDEPGGVGGLVTDAAVLTR